MLVFDFSVGAGTTTQIFRDFGDTVIEVPLTAKHDSDENKKFKDLTSGELIEKYGRPDFIWSSPPCVAFSVASLHHHWIGGINVYEPGTPTARDSVDLVNHLRLLIDELNPVYGFIIENPRGVLRKLKVFADYERQTVTYCQYGDFRMKPTDLWGSIPGWSPRSVCRNGDSCHEAAPRGSRSGTVGLHKSNRATIPVALPLEIRTALQELEHRGEDYAIARRAERATSVTNPQLW
jgi:hypothetical protein